MNSLSEVAVHCGRPDRSGAGWKCCCPICGRHSFVVTPALANSVYCFNCSALGYNDGHSEQRQILVKAGLLPDSHAQFDPKEYEELMVRKRMDAADLWNAGFLGSGGIFDYVTADNMAGRYLRRRGLEAFIGHPALRFIPCSLAARVWHVNHGVTAIQYTYLRFYSGPDDIIVDPQLRRKTEGVLSGGGVWIGAPTAEEEVVVAEGLETCLSAMLILNLKCGVAVLGPNLKNLVLPKVVRRVHIAADNDETGRGASACAAKQWRERGLRVRMSVPDREGEDFNDVLVGGRDE
jgi:Toprim domain